MTRDKLVVFERAFSMHMGTCRATCDCGKVYFDNYNGAISWEEGELESLRKSAIACEGSLGYIELEGRQYVDVCKCWHPRAEKVMAFIDRHARNIADYLNGEKQRLHAEADSVPEVKGAV